MIQHSLFASSSARVLVQRGFVRVGSLIQADDVVVGHRRARVALAARLGGPRSLGGAHELDGRLLVVAPRAEFAQEQRRHLLHAAVACVSGKGGSAVSAGLRGQQAQGAWGAPKRTL